MKQKLFTLLIAVMASLGTMFAESGTCGDNLTWDLTNGVLTISGTGAMEYFYSASAPWYSSRSYIRMIVINDGVTSIGGHAFQSCSSVTSVTIPNSVASIGEMAFFNCSGLTSVMIPNSVTSIGYDAFRGCSSLTLIEIPNSVTSIGEYAFYECSGLTSAAIGSNVTSIGKYAFYNCRGLASVTIGNSVKSIGYAVFSGCSSLTLIEIPNSVTSIEEWAFSRCSGLTSVEIPNSVTSIGNSAFSGCSNLITVTIGNSVTSIGEKAFDSCSSLISVTLNSNAIVRKNYSSLNIGYIFGSQVTEYIIGDSVTSIGNYAFQDCNSLTSVTIPSSVTSIGNSAFKGCSGLTSFTNYATTPQAINANVFTNVNKSTCTLYVPAESVEAYQAAYVWKEFGNILAIDDSTEEVNYATLADIYNMAADSTFTLGAFDVMYVPDFQSGSNMYIKDSTGSCVIYKVNYGLQAGDHVEAGLQGKVSIYNGLHEVIPITAKEELTITHGEAPAPMVATEVPSLNNASQYVVYEGVSFTTDTAFVEGRRHTVYGSWNGQTITFYNQYYIGATLSANKTYNITAVNTIYLTTPEAYPLAVEEVSPAPCIIASGTCGAQGDNLTWTLTCDSVLTISGTGEMADYEWNVSPFFSNLSISSVVIDDGVTSIGEYIFNHCSNIKEVVIPSSVTTIGFGAFHLCTSLVTIEIPDSVTSIGESSFSNCTSLTAVTIGSNVTRIEGWAFENNNSLISFTSYCTTPPTIDSNRPAFVGSYLSTCTLYVPAESVEAYQTANGWGVFGNILPIEDEPAPCILASGICGVEGDNLTWELSCDSVLTISGTGAMSDYSYSSSVPWYSYRSSIKSVVITDGVTSIGEAAFVYCTGLTSVTIPNSVTSIGEMAFYYCTVLTSVTIPNSVTSIGRWAFEGCTGLTSIDVASDNSNYCSEDGVLFNKDKTTLIRYPGGKQGSYTIPNSVTSIGGGAFAFCKGLTSVTIPNSVTSIESDAFRYCTGLTSVTIPNSVTSIGDWAFSDCSGLTSINVASDNSNYCSVDGVLFNKDKTTLIQYPGGKQGAYTIPNSVTSIGNNAFYECTGLTSVTIPNSVTSIGEWAFAYCRGLTSVTIPNSVTSIGRDAFYNCSGLTSVTIGNSVTSIGDGAFSGCSGLTSIEIPNSVTSIGSSAFWGCSGLTSVTIGNSVTSIGGSAFHRCTGLTSITCEAITPPTLGSDVFYTVDKSIPLYVPAESVEAYQTADQWKDFTNIIGLDDGDEEESNIRYIDPSNNELGSETVSLHLPDVPEIEGFTFLKWQVVAGDLEEGIIIQAVYQADESTSASSVYTNPANPAQKLIRNGNVYILSNEKTYSITGQEVK